MQQTLTKVTQYFWEPASTKKIGKDSEVQIKGWFLSQLQPSIQNHLLHDQDAHDPAKSNFSESDSQKEVLSNMDTFILAALVRGQPSLVVTTCKFSTTMVAAPDCSYPFILGGKIFQNYNATSTNECGIEPEE